MTHDSKLKSDIAEWTSSLSPENSTGEAPVKFYKTRAKIAFYLLTGIFLILVLGIGCEFLSHLDYLSSGVGKEVFTIFREDLMPAATFIIGYLFSGK